MKHDTSTTLAAAMFTLGTLGAAYTFLGATETPAHAQGVGGAAAIQAEIRNELRALNTKLDGLAGKLDGGLEVRVTSMPNSGS